MTYEELLKQKNDPSLDYASIIRGQMFPSLVPPSNLTPTQQGYLNPEMTEEQKLVYDYMKKRMGEQDKIYENVPNAEQAAADIRLASGLSLAGEQMASGLANQKPDYSSSQMLSQRASEIEKEIPTYKDIYKASTTGKVGAMGNQAQLINALTNRAKYYKGLSESVTSSDKTSPESQMYQMIAARQWPTDANGKAIDPGFWKQFSATELKKGVPEITKIISGEQKATDSIRKAQAQDELTDYRNAALKFREKQFGLNKDKFAFAQETEEFKQKYMNDQIASKGWELMLKEKELVNKGIKDKAEMQKWINDNKEKLLDLKVQLSKQNIDWQKALNEIEQINVSKKEAEIKAGEAGTKARQAGVAEREAGVKEREAAVKEQMAGIKAQEAQIKSDKYKNLSDKTSPASKLLQETASEYDGKDYSQLSGQDILDTMPNVRNLYLDKIKQKDSEIKEREMQAREEQIQAAIAKGNEMTDIEKKKTLSNIDYQMAELNRRITKDQMDYAKDQEDINFKKQQELDKNKLDNYRLQRDLLADQQKAEIPTKVTGLTPYQKAITGDRLYRTEMQQHNNMISKLDKDTVLKPLYQAVQTLDRAAALVTQSEKLTPAQLAELQSAVRRVTQFGITGGAQTTGVERDKMDIKSTLYKLENLKGELTNTVGEINPDDPIVRHILEIAKIERKNALLQAKGRVKILLQGMNTSLYKNHPDWQKELQEKGNSVVQELGETDDSLYTPMFKHKPGLLERAGNWLGIINKKPEIPAGKVMITGPGGTKLVDKAKWDAATDKKGYTEVNP